jgi:multiple sugar transport system permease protein
LSKIAAGYVYLVPVAAVLMVVVAWPLISAVWLSLHQSYLLLGINSSTFVGLDNYQTLLRDPRTLVFAHNTAIYVVGSVIGDLGVGLVLALLLNRPLPLRWLWRGMAIIPWAMPITVTGLTWRWILDGQWGILNYGLTKAGLIDRYIAWLSQDPWVWLSLLTVSVWASYPFAFVNLLAGLQGIPGEVYEAARLDGANAWREFRNITLPFLRPVIAVTVLLVTILHVREFMTIWIMTSGGPGIETTTLSPLVYIESFRFFKMGYGASIGVVLLAVNAVFAFFYLRQVRFTVEDAKEAV